MKISNFITINSALLVSLVAILVIAIKPASATTLYDSGFYNPLKEAEMSLGTGAQPNVRFKFTNATMTQASGVTLWMQRNANSTGGNIYTQLMSADCATTTYATSNKTSVQFNADISTTGKFGEWNFESTVNLNPNTEYCLRVHSGLSTIQPSQILIGYTSSNQVAFAELAHNGNPFNPINDLSGWIYNNFDFSDLAQPVIYFPSEDEVLTYNQFTVIGQCIVDTDLPQIYELYDYKIYGIVAEDDLHQYDFVGQCIDGNFNVHVDRQFYNSTNWSVFVWQIITDAGGLSGLKHQVTSVGRNFTIAMANNPIIEAGLIPYNDFGCQSYTATPILCTKKMFYELFVPQTSDLMIPLQETKALMDTKIPFSYLTEAIGLLTDLANSTPSGNPLIEFEVELNADNPKFGATTLSVNAFDPQDTDLSNIVNQLNPWMNGLLWLGFLWYAGGRTLSVFKPL